ncbi:hypothetical protein ACDW39_10865, partial|uniref:hypothetical protein n=1 Tax=Clostridioides difficile TaxID=1496 RepID=UPI0035585CAB
MIETTRSLQIQVNLRYWLLKEKVNNSYKILELIKKATKMNDLDIYKAVQEQLTRPIIQFR